MKKVAIIGGGFGGLTAAKMLKQADLHVILIDKTNHHVFQPLLYQVATAALSPADIAAPIREILRKQKNTTVIMGNVDRIDIDQRKIYSNGLNYDYDYLVVSVGSRHSYFGKKEWEKFAPGLKTISDALNIREKILLSYEKAERLDDEAEIQKFLTFVIVGGGPTGVELAGAIAEIAHKSLMRDFRKIDPSNTRIILVEGEDRILTAYDRDLGEKAKQSLENLGATVVLNKRVTDINENGVEVEGEFVPAENVIWAAGNTIPPLLKDLNTEYDRAGRVLVEKDCSVKNHPEIFVIGDAAYLENKGKQLPGIAPVAIQQGKYVGKIIRYQIPSADREPFKYFDKGNLATIGRARAIMQIGNFKISGFVAWIAWVFIHIMYLIGFRNRYKVLAEWAWYYLTYRQGIRLITRRSDM